MTTLPVRCQVLEHDHRNNEPCEDCVQLRDLLPSGAQVGYIEITHAARPGTHYYRFFAANLLGGCPGRATPHPGHFQEITAAMTRILAQPLTTDPSSQVIALEVDGHTSAYAVTAALSRCLFGAAGHIDYYCLLDVEMRQ